MKAEILFATYDGLPDCDDDDLLVKSELERQGMTVKAMIWDQPGQDWGQGQLCVIRSTWDYHKKYNQFTRWIEQVAASTRLLNPKDIVLWNSRKTYLRDLAAAGVPIVPTAWIPCGSSGSASDIAALLLQHGWSRAVIKPAVGLATHGVHKIDLQESVQGTRHELLARAQAHTDELAKSTDVMVQPYLSSVEDYGERALVFIAGEYSHAVRKSAFQALKPAGEAGETAACAQPEELALARQVLAAAPSGWLYARVDLVRDQNNRPYLIELEMVEPSLFFALGPGSEKRFAQALKAQLADPLLRASGQTHVAPTYKTPPAPARG